MGARAPLPVGRDLVLPAEELAVSFARSGGPGGQNVNKVETKVLLRFSIERSRVLSEEQRERLREKLRSRLTTDGEILVQSDRHRDRIRNLEDARERLAEVLAAALVRRRPRRKSRPTRGSVERRLETKHKRSAIKRARRQED